MFYLIVLFFRCIKSSVCLEESKGGLRVEEGCISFCVGIVAGAIESL